ncbi:BRO family protein [Clostridium sp. HBUAS56010]|uniref:BRO-N domain-containing protein n=1 Tax=Clostridium sp. HBUAS56010 TaxID=2571127 RepID=UPI001177BEA8|nr:BRO family protein [Clostridium sp. HBUAS56010]
MNKMMKIFNNEEFGNVRVIDINDKPYFVGNDVARALGYVEPKNAILRHCKGALKQSFLTEGGKQELKVIPEGDIYRLIMKSKLPSAERFESWVFDEVLPSIRKHGIYATEETIDKILNDPDFGIKLLTQLKEERNRNVLLNKENDALAEKNLKWAGRKFINACVRRYAGFACEGNFGNAWTEFKKEILYKHSINLNSRITHYLNSTGKKTKPKTLDMLDDLEVPKAVSTIVSMCREKAVDISDLLENVDDKEMSNE